MQQKKFARKIGRKGAVRAGKGFTLFILNEVCIINITKSLGYSNVLIDGITETVKSEMKKTRVWVSSCIISTISRFISATSNFFSNKKYK